VTIVSQNESLEACVTRGKTTEDDSFVSMFNFKRVAARDSLDHIYTFHSRIRLQVQNVSIAHHRKPRRCGLATAESRKGEKKKGEAENGLFFSSELEVYLPPSLG